MDRRRTRTTTIATYCTAYFCAVGINVAIRAFVPGVDLLAHGVIGIGLGIAAYLITTLLLGRTDDNG